MKKKKKDPLMEFTTGKLIGRTLFYTFVLILLVLIYGFHDSNTGSFIYNDF